MVRLMLAMLVALPGMNMAHAETYVNERYGVTLDIPETFRADPDWDSDEGQRYTARGGASLIVWGLEDGVDYRDIRDFRDWWAETFRNSGEITYEAGEDDWYVLSGFERERIFYLRVEEGESCDGQPVLAAFLIRYWPRQRDIFDDRIKALGESLDTGACS